MVNCFAVPAMNGGVRTFASNGWLQEAQLRSRLNRGRLSLTDHLNSSNPRHVCRADLSSVPEGKTSKSYALFLSVKLAWLIIALTFTVGLQAARLRRKDSRMDDDSCALRCELVLCN